MFINEKGKVITELGSEKRLWDLALLCDTRHHYYNLNTKLQGQERLISDMFQAVRTFETDKLF